jgi:hypothetical protein
MTETTRQDRYPHLGRRMTIGSFNECIEVARRIYPRCSFEGSGGPERTIFNRGQHVGHCWPVGKDWDGKWFMRLSGGTTS